MVPSIPVPTDNLWKFYALFGLTLIITPCVGLLYVSNTFYEKIYEADLGIAAIEAKTQRGPAEKTAITVFKNKEIRARNSLRIGAWGFTFLLTIGFVATARGFQQWEKLQAALDTLQRLELSKAEREERKALAEALNDSGPTTS